MQGCNLSLSQCHTSALANRALTGSTRGVREALLQLREAAVGKYRGSKACGSGKQRATKLLGFFRTVPSITYRDAYKSTGRVGRLEEVHLPLSVPLAQRLLSQRLQQISLRARRRRASSLAARKESGHAPRGSPRARAASDARRGEA